jgi:hypothetical protein
MRCTTLWSSSASLPLMAASQHCLSSSTDVQPASAIVQTGLEPQVSLSYGGQSSGRCCCAASSAIVERRRIPGQRASVDASPDCDVRPVIDLPDRRTSGSAQIWSLDALLTSDLSSAGGAQAKSSL